MWLRGDGGREAGALPLPNESSKRRESDIQLDAHLGRNARQDLFHFGVDRRGPACILESQDDSERDGLDLAGPPLVGRDGECKGAGAVDGQVPLPHDDVVLHAAPRPPHEPKLSRKLVGLWRRLGGIVVFRLLFGYRVHYRASTNITTEQSPRKIRA